MKATDTKKRPLTYLWSLNGGQISGSGAQVEIDAGGLAPGVYSVAGAAQDSSRRRATCTATFQVLPPAGRLTATCVVESSQVQRGAVARFKAEVSGNPARPLRYQWIANAGKIQPQGAEAALPTAELPPGSYSVTSRVEDDLGQATDCTVNVTVVLPPPPVAPPELAVVAEIVFSRNAYVLSEQERGQLGQVLDRLRSGPKGRVSIESYAAPDETQPQKLASERAEAVRKFLVDGGIDPSRLKTRVGVGGSLGGVRNRTLDVVWIPDGMDY